MLQEGYSDYCATEQSNGMPLCHAQDLPAENLVSRHTDEMGYNDVTKQATGVGGVAEPGNNSMASKTVLGQPNTALTSNTPQPLTVQARNALSPAFGNHLPGNDKHSRSGVLVRCTACDSLVSVEATAISPLQLHENPGSINIQSSCQTPHAASQFTAGAPDSVKEQVHGQSTSGSPGSKNGRNALGLSVSVSRSQKASSEISQPFSTVVVEPAAVVSALVATPYVDVPLSHAADASDAISDLAQQSGCMLATTGCQCQGLASGAAAAQCKIASFGAAACGEDPLANELSNRGLRRARQKQQEASRASQARKQKAAVAGRSARAPQV